MIFVKDEVTIVYTKVSQSMNSEMDEFLGTFPGTIKAPLDVPSLTKRADIVCRGEVVYVYDEGEVKYLVGNETMIFIRMVAVLHVDNIYKGTILENRIEIEFLQPSFPSSMESMNEGGYWLVFLMAKNGRYQFANLTTSKMPISRELFSIKEGGVLPLVLIRKVLIHSLKDVNNNVVLAAIEQLAKLKSKETVAALGPMVDSQNPDISDAAKAALLYLGDLT